MDFVITFVDSLVEATTVALAGLLCGLVFGIAAQRSAFCLRAATLEFARGTLGPRTAVRLLTFSTVLVWVQLAVQTGLIPGVVLGASLSAIQRGEFHFHGCDRAASMQPSIAGAALMGFGGVLAGAAPLDRASTAPLSSRGQLGSRRAHCGREPYRPTFSSTSRRTAAPSRPRENSGDRYRH